MDGDYKSPPPKGKYDALFEYSKSLMKRVRTSDVEYAIAEEHAGELHLDVEVVKA